MSCNNLESSRELYEHHRILVDAGQELLRIDKFLMIRLPNVTRNKVQYGIRDGHVTVNGHSVKPNHRVHPGDDISVLLPNLPKVGTVIPEKIDLDIVMEDDHLLVVNKPAGMVVHPAYQNWSGTLVNALTYHFNNLPKMAGNDNRPGLVHRIDKDTSGLLVVAKTDEAMGGLAQQFFDHSIERTYYALVWGVPESTEGTIDVKIGRNQKDRKVIKAFPNGDFGKHAITHYKIIKNFYYVSLLRCNLETGRTHQIRAHMKYLGHPLFNDATYGGDQILKGTIFTKYKQFVNNCFKMMPRQALHAKTLGFIHPITKEKVNIDSTLPQDFENVLNKWGHYLIFDKRE